MNEVNEVKEPKPEAETPKTPPATPPPAPAQAEVKKSPPAPKTTGQTKETEPKKGPSLLVRVLRAILLLFILVGLGAILVVFLLYIPTRQSLEDTRRQMANISSQSETQLQEAQQTIDNLSKLEKQNQALQEQLDQSGLRMALLQIRTDVLTAQLALYKEDTEKASLALSTTLDTLEQLQELLPKDQRQFVEALKTRLELILSEIKTNDVEAAQTDLDLLINKLLEIEDALIR